MLATLGDLLEDVVVHVSAEPTRGTDTPAVIVRTRGGSAANVAAAAALGGGPVRFIGRIGDDELGVQLAGALEAAGVDVKVQRVGRTGSVVVLVSPDGERTMMPDRAAAGDLDSVDPGWLAGVEWLHVPAYSLVSEPIASAAVAAMADVARRGGRVSVDLSSVAVIEAFGVDRFAALLDVIAPDVVFANDDEERLAPFGGRWITIVKHGSDPVTVRCPGEADAHVPVLPVSGVTDTTGAGDAFAAGFIIARLAGVDVLEAVRSGNALASRTLRQAGARILRF